MSARSEVTGRPEKILSASDEVKGFLEITEASDRWSFITTSDDEVVAFHITVREGGSPLNGFQVRVLLPGDVLAARMDTNTLGNLGAAIVGRETNWTVELKKINYIHRPILDKALVGEDMNETCT